MTRRSAVVPLGRGYRRAAALAVGGLLLTTGAAACGDDAQDAQPVCGYEDGSDFIVVDQDECDDDDRDRDHHGHSLIFMHFPVGTSYVPGSRYPAASSAFSSRPSTVSKGYGSGTVRTGGFGSGTSGGGAKAGSGSGGG